MKSLSLTIYIFALALFLPSQVVAFELTKDNPESLIGTNSSEYTIAGIMLGITHDHAWRLLENNNSLVGIKDKGNPERIYVYSRNKDGTKGKAVLYLIWEPGMKKMERITIFQDYRSNLSQNFRRLLTFEAVDNNSEFKKRFIGYANKSKITLDIPSIDLKHTTYFYNEIGIEITNQHSSDGDKVVFALTLSQP